MGTPGPRFGSSPSRAGGGWGAGGGGFSGTAGAGSSTLDDRQRLQAMADRQIRFAKLTDDSFADVKRRAGLVSSVADAKR